jgi:hypothetical protein
MNDPLTRLAALIGVAVKIGHPMIDAIDKALDDCEAVKERAEAFASLVALAERSSVLDVSLGWYIDSRKERRWCCTIEFMSGAVVDAVADSPDAAVKAVEAKMQEREDIQSGLMEDT